METENVVLKETHVAGNNPQTMTTENTVAVPVQKGSDIEGQINAAKGEHHYSGDNLKAGETLTIEKSIDKAKY